MSDSNNFTFTDVSDGDEVWVGIRFVEGGTGLALSKKASGDIEVFLPPEAVTRLAAALRPETRLAPQHELPEDWAAELRAAFAGRGDVRAVYWLTTVYETDDGTVAQDELHIELAEPPAGQAAEVGQVRELSRVIPGNGPVWSITPQRILADVREVGLRVV